ncbi:type I methionyl aminopeptidase [Candidatus Gracilibacteria bacterium]|nr:type I methionyl aminopeptidase [Candidatus Gracilibacteria bacterium]
MLSEKELNIMRKNGLVHKQVFDAVKKMLVPGVSAKQVDDLALKICKQEGVLSAFTGVYGYKYTLQTSVNNVVVHGRPLQSIIFEQGDVVTIDFGVKDKKHGICTDAAFTMIVGDSDKYPEKKEFLRVGEKALQKGLEQATAGNTVGDIGSAIEKYVLKHGYHIIRELTGHGVGKTLHEQPYIYNYGTPGTGTKLKAGMTLAIEPILGLTSGQITDKGDWEIYVADGSIGCQFEHCILVTDGKPEIIV